MKSYSGRQVADGFQSVYLSPTKRRRRRIYLLGSNSNFNNIDNIEHMSLKNLKVNHDGHPNTKCLDNTTIANTFCY